MSGDNSIPNVDEILAESERRNIQKTVFDLENKKQIAEERFKNLFENALVGLFRIRLTDGELLDINQEALRIFGSESQEDFSVQIRTDDVFFPFLGSPEQKKQLQQGTPITYTFNTQKRNGEELFAQVTVKFLSSTGFIEGAVKDITDLMEVQQQLKQSIESEKQARADAQQASQAKSRFLANISHEIRTPLNSIVGYSEILMSTTDPGNQKIYGKEILQESEKLMTLINQLLDLSKIEADKIKLDKAHFHLNNLLDESLRPLILSMQEKDLDMILNIHKDVPVNLFGDSFRLRQILLNLLSNAVKFTNEGSIRLSVELEGTRDHLTCLLFSVSDTGIGIAQDKLSNITESFEQAAPSTEREFGGTGLGLSIARRLIELMGGKLFVKSRLDQGSTFSFTCFFETLDEITDDRDRPIDTVFTTEIKGSILGTKVLVCEDYATNQQIVYHHLTGAGCDVTIVNNGKEAVETLKRENFDLVLMDLQMPVMGGLEATKNIRRIPGKEHIPIMGMTAAAFKKDKESCFQAGMNDFIAKPIRRNVLINKIKRWVLLQDKLEEIPEKSEERQKEFSFRYDDFLKEMSIDRKQAEGIIKGFINSVMEKLPHLERQMETGEWEELASQFHAIKGGALNIMADKLADLARIQEEAVKAREPHRLKELYPMFLSEFNKLINLFHFNSEK